MTHCRKDPQARRKVLSKGRVRLLLPLGLQRMLRHHCPRAGEVGYMSGSPGAIVDIVDTGTVMTPST